MNINDILEIEQMKYCYEQAYTMHRQAEIPQLFVQNDDTVFTIPSAGDVTIGWTNIYHKFTEDLPFVSPNEDSYHTGWQICTPFLWEDKNSNTVCGLFPTFGYLVLSMDPKVFQPPYQVLASLEMWNDKFEKTSMGWQIKYLQAQFLMGQCSWSWDTAGDEGVAVKGQLREVEHPFWKRGMV